MAARRKTSLKPHLDPDRLPAHVAIIMDGNGRWARKRGLPRVAGHREGIKSVRAVVEASREIGISVLTLYAFSSENWKRPRGEVTMLMRLLSGYLRDELANLKEHGIRLRTIGHPEHLPKYVQRELERTRDETRDNTDMVLNLALSYGSRAEIVEAAQEFAAQVQAQGARPEDLTEARFASYLHTDGLPDPDLVIRSGGEHRVSNFLLWQLSYAELYITDAPWPDFREADLYAALLDFQRRQRRFGGV